MYEAKIIADSISPQGDRLTTIEVEYPHAVHKDVMTHRMLDRNFLSFRAFPPEKVIAKIEDDPFIPESFDARIKGMGQGEAIADQERASAIWSYHLADSIHNAKDLMTLNVAKAQVNFILQDLTWIRGIITATDWDNFWALRSWPDNVRPEVKKIASMMEEAYKASEPKQLGYDDVHMPYISNQDYELARGLLYGLSTHEHEEERTELLKKVSTARCARISYLTHDGRRDLNEDLRLYKDLFDDGHMSPFGHVARPFSKGEWEAIWDAAEAIDKHKAIPTQVRSVMIRQLMYRANLKGWHQHRKDIVTEEDYSRRSFNAEAK